MDNPCHDRAAELRDAKPRSARARRKNALAAELFQTLGDIHDEGFRLGLKHGVEHRGR